MPDRVNCFSANGALLLLPTHLIGTTPLGLPHLHSSCLTSDSLTLLMPPNHSTHTVHPAHPTYTTGIAHFYCDNCQVLPVHAPTCYQSSPTCRVCSHQVTLPSIQVPVYHLSCVTTHVNNCIYS